MPEQRRQDVGKGLRQDDMLRALAKRHADGKSALDLSLRDRLNAGADDLGHIGRGVQGQRENADPQFGPARGCRHEMRQGEIDDVDLQQKRGRADRLYIHFGGDGNQPAW
nr:hypothetical protein [Nitratireductor aquibiodomus]